MGWRYPRRRGSRTVQPIDVEREAWILPLVESCGTSLCSRWDNNIDNNGNNNNNNNNNNCSSSSSSNNNNNNNNNSSNIFMCNRRGNERVEVTAPWPLEIWLRNHQAPMHVIADLRPKGSVVCAGWKVTGKTKKVFRVTMSQRRRTPWKIKGRLK